MLCCKECPLETENTLTTVLFIDQLAHQRSHTLQNYAHKHLRKMLAKQAARDQKEQEEQEEQEDGEEQEEQEEQEDGEEQEEQDGKANRGKQGANKENKQGLSQQGAKE